MLRKRDTKRDKSPDEGFGEGQNVMGPVFVEKVIRRIIIREPTYEDALNQLSGAVTPTLREIEAQKPENQKARKACDNGYGYAAFSRVDTSHGEHPHFMFPAEDVEKRLKKRAAKQAAKKASMSTPVKKKVAKKKVQEKTEVKMVTTTEKVAKKKVLKKAVKKPVRKKAVKRR